MAKEYELDEQLKALADPVRMRVVKLLALPMRSRGDEQDRGLCACDIESVMGVGQSTVSHHMKLLSNAGLVRSEKKGRWVYYRLNPSAFAALSQALGQFAREGADCVSLGESPQDPANAPADCCDGTTAPPAEGAAPGKRLRVIAKHKQA